MLPRQPSRGANGRRFSTNRPAPAFETRVGDARTVKAASDLHDLRFLMAQRLVDILNHIVGHALNLIRLGFMLVLA